MPKFISPTPKLSTESTYPSDTLGPLYINSPTELYWTVANHLGVFAGTNSGKSFRSGHFLSAYPCQLICPERCIIDNF